MAVQSVIRKVKNFERLYDDSTQAQIEEEELTPEERANLKMLNQKKSQIMSALNAQTSSQKLSVEKVKDIAQQWMELAD